MWTWVNGLSVNHMFISYDAVFNYNTDILPARATKCMWKLFLGQLFSVFLFEHIEISPVLYVIIRNWKMCQNACTFEDWCPV